MKKINYTARYRRSRTAYALVLTATVVALLYPLPLLVVCALILAVTAAVTAAIALKQLLRRRGRKRYQKRGRAIWNADTAVMPVVRPGPTYYVPRQYPFDPERLNLMRDFEANTGEIKI